MTAASETQAPATSETQAPAKRPSWFAKRFTIFADDDSPPERPKDQTLTGSPVRQAWASLFTGIRRLLPPRLGGVSESAVSSQPASSTPERLIQVEKLGGASKWAAGGFSAVTALLLFFGVKEGVLDQAIRFDPFATLYVFMLLGLGVLCALFAGAINPAKRIHLWTLLAAIAAMLVLTAVFLPNLDFFKGAEKGVQNVLNGSAPATAPGILARVISRIIFWGWILLVAFAVLAFPVSFLRWRDKATRSSGWDVAILLCSGCVLLAAAGFAIASASRQTRLSVATGALLLGAIAWSFAHKPSLPAAPSLPAVAGLIILGVAATSLGLYGAAKVSVGTKIGAVTPQVSASLEQANGQTFLKIVAVASRMRGEKLLISVAGIPRTQELPLRDAAGMTPGEIWQSVLQPNSLDEIDTTFTVPIVPTRWELIWVSHCQVTQQRFREGKRTCTHRKEVSLDLRLRNLTPEAGSEITGHIVVASTKSLKVTLTGRSVAWGSQIQAEICRAHNGGHARQLAFATLTPDVTGTVTWNVPVPAGGNGDELVLQYRRCPGEDCPDPNRLENMTQLAKYVLP
jgi:hypothetical protein